jgi:hypothetical protein
MDGCHDRGTYADAAVDPSAQTLQFRDFIEVRTVLVGVGQRVCMVIRELVEKIDEEEYDVSCGDPPPFRQRTSLPDDGDHRTQTAVRVSASSWPVST